jgi:hypothetical protein
MHHGDGLIFRDHRCDKFVVGDVTDLKRAPFDGPAMTGGKIVECHGLIAAGCEYSARVAADISGTAGYKHMAHCILILAVSKSEVIKQNAAKH